MTFKSYYAGLDEQYKKDIRNLIMRKTGCSQATFYYWISDRFKNNMAKLTRDAISKIIGIPADELFEKTINIKA